jgi:isoleucyl-tRNA synthetase
MRRRCACVAQEWEATVTRVGRWIDFENDYKTLDPEFMARHRSHRSATARSPMCALLRRYACAGERVVGVQDAPRKGPRLPRLQGAPSRAPDTPARSRCALHRTLTLTLPKKTQVMPYSTACNTPLSNFEAGLDYRDVSDPAIMVRQRLPR